MIVMSYFCSVCNTLLSKFRFYNEIHKQNITKKKNWNQLCEYLELILICFSLNIISNINTIKDYTSLSLK